MRKFTEPQVKLLTDLVEGALAGIEYSPGDGRSGEALLKTGLIESGGCSGYTSMYKLTDLGLEKFKVDKLINKLNLNFLISDPLYSKYLESRNKADRLAAEAAKLEMEQYELIYEAYCVDGCIHDLVKGNGNLIRSTVENALWEE
jgi:hypothetical protein